MHLKAAILMSEIILGNLIVWHRLRIVGYKIRLAVCRVRLKYLKWRRMWYDA